MKLLILITITMVAFAGNSLLCRLALDKAKMDPASFTSIRILSGALALWLIITLSKPSPQETNRPQKGNWLSAFCLFAYAACFSYAYVNLATATGALLLFGSVQATMIGHGIYSGEKLKNLQLAGLLLALTGLTYLLWPGQLSAPPLKDSIIMITSGTAWGIYSLRGRGADAPTSVTSGNFIKAIPFTLILSAATLSYTHINQIGLWAAIISGSITSGIGYALWYRVLPSLKSTTAATVQLSVPVIAAFAGVIFLSESISLRLILSTLAILGGIALVILENHPKPLDKPAR